MTPTDLNFSPVSHEINSGEAPKEGKFAEGPYSNHLNSYPLIYLAFGKLQEKSTKLHIIIRPTGLASGII